MSAILVNAPCINTGHIELHRMEETGELVAMHVTQTRTPIAAQKFITTNTQAIPNAFPSYGDLTTTFNLVARGKEWAAAAIVKKLPISWQMTPRLNVHKKVVLTPRCGIDATTKIEGDTGDEMTWKYSTVEYLPPVGYKVVIALANGFPQVFALDNENRIRRIQLPNVHSSGEVCADPYTKHLISGEIAPADFKQVVGKVTRNSSMSELAWATIKLWFTTPSNQDLVGRTDAFLAPVDEKGGIAPVQLPTSLIHGAIVPTNSLVRQAIEALTR